MAGKARAACGVQHFADLIFDWLCTDLGGSSVKNKVRDPAFDFIRGIDERGVWGQDTAAHGREGIGRDY